MEIFFQFDRTMVRNGKVFNVKAPEFRQNLKLFNKKFESLKDIGDNYLHKKIDEIRSDQIAPSEDLKRELYRLHKEVVESSVLSFNKKERLLNLIFSYEPWSWRVVGISKKAINEFKENNFKRIETGGPQRDHFFKMRKDTIRQIMNSVMPYEDWWSLFWEGDRTIIVTKDEHKKNLITKENFDVNEHSFFKIELEGAF